MKQPAWLNEFAANTFSQSGEDGVLAKCLTLLSERDGWCVEFGAGDGIRFSNSRRLIVDDGYRAILIEGDPDRYQALSQTYAGQTNVYTLQAVVGLRERDGLDSLLAQYPVPRNFDFLSIDIDGNDYHVWERIQAYRPKLVCVEFNPTIPTEVDFVQEPLAHLTQGCSLSSAYGLGKRKGYELICVLPFNAIFVDAAYFAAFDITDNHPRLLRRHTEHVTWLFSGYDGSIHISGMCRLPWHDVRIEESALQILPSYFRLFPERYSKFRRRLFSLCRKLRLLRQ